MAPGALQQRQMSSISDPSFTQPKKPLSFTFSKPETRVNLASGEDIVSQQTAMNVVSSASGGSSPRVLKTHAAIRSNNYLLNNNFDDLDRLRDALRPKQVDNAVLLKYSQYVENAFKGLVAGNYADDQGPVLLNKLFSMVCKARVTPDLARELCNRFRACGGIRLLIENCVSADAKLQFSSARLLVESLTPENRDYVVKHGLESVMHVVCSYKCRPKSLVEQSKVSTGFLAEIFEHSEATCTDVIQLGGLDVILAECKSRDADVRRNCARALANLSLYGGTRSHRLMVHHHAHTWLFALAFADDDDDDDGSGRTYHALLAAAVLAAHQDVDGACDALCLIDPFVAKHSAAPADHSGFGPAGPSWLRRLVPVLRCDRRESRTLAAFHFCAEAEAEAARRSSAAAAAPDGLATVFGEIGAVDALRELAGATDGAGSGFAARALRSVGQQVPRPLSQQVCSWTAEDVVRWTRSKGFGWCAECLASDHSLDGRWLLSLTEERLGACVGMRNGITRKRFMRELYKLKALADYSCIDKTNLNSFLQSIGTEFSIYTYSMLNAGIDCESIRDLTEDQLKSKCKITNSIHRHSILYHIKDITDSDTFISETS